MLPFVWPYPVRIASSTCMLCGLSRASSCLIVNSPSVASPTKIIYNLLTLQIWRHSPIPRRKVERGLPLHNVQPKSSLLNVSRSLHGRRTVVKVDERKWTRPLWPCLTAHWSYVWLFWEVSKLSVSSTQQGSLWWFDRNVVCIISIQECFIDLSATGLSLEFNRFVGIPVQPNSHPVVTVRYRILGNVMASLFLFILYWVNDDPPWQCSLVKSH